MKNLTLKLLGDKEDNTYYMI